MSVQTLTNQEAQTVKASKPLITGKKFDIIFFIAVLWLTAGTFADAWAHNNIVRLETFWTPWHGILYSGLAALIITLTSVLFINHRRGVSWSQAIPQGYIVTYLAMPLMMLDGLGDMTWHSRCAYSQPSWLALPLLSTWPGSVLQRMLCGRFTC